MKRILIIAAHPDDEVLGCGATVTRLIEEYNCKAYTLILGEGVTSRNSINHSNINSKSLDNLTKECLRANKILGIKKVFRYNFPDQRFDSVNILDIVKVIEKHINKIKPDTIFTHFENDINIDHKITYLATMAATRPTPNNLVKELYSFEVLSSTEWSFPLRFSPNTFFRVVPYLDTKIKAMQAYSSELRIFPHPRSIKSIQLNAELWGTKVGLGLAEAFINIRNLN